MRPFALLVGREPQSYAASSVSTTAVRLVASYLDPRDIHTGCLQMNSIGGADGMFWRHQSRPCELAVPNGQKQHVGALLNHSNYGEFIEVFEQRNSQSLKRSNAREQLGHSPTASMQSKPAASPS